MKLSLAQLNPKVGAITENRDQLLAAYGHAKNQGCDALVASELYLSGYPPEDLILKGSFLAHISGAVETLVAQTASGPALIFGTPWREAEFLYNSVVIAQNGEMQIRHKYHLPNYGVFDEARLFSAGALPMPVILGRQKIGMPICEDIWFADVAQHLRAHGAEILLTLNASPFERGKKQTRLLQAQNRVAETDLPLVYVNQYGGQDELVFDGGSFALNQTGEIILQAPFWQAGTYTLDLTEPSSALKEAADDELSDIYQAAVTGLRDYVDKNGFPSVLLGLSGGIDSALCAAIAVDALGAKRVHCVMLPSIYTSTESLEDARACAQALGVRLDNISIAPMVSALEDGLSDLFSGREADITEENIQSRLRGTLLMALSNKFGHMLVTTGNKSEISVGYATLYGDMNGGYNPIKDIYKSDVFALARWRNQQSMTIPQNIIDKPPSAELRPDQKDEDSLPPYEVLDDILYRLVEQEQSFAEICAAGHAAEIVQQIERLLYIAEYKRRQSAPGVKIGQRNFGRDRRYPITNGFRDAREKI